MINFLFLYMECGFIMIGQDKIVFGYIIHGLVFVKVQMDIQSKIKMVIIVLRVVKIPFSKQ